MLGRMPLLPVVARTGYAAKGVVYLCIGYVAARAAFAAGSPQGASGALQALPRGPGRWLLLAVCVGLLAHVAWRVVQVLRDPEHPGEHRVAVRAFLGVSAVVYASLAFAAFRQWQGRPSGGDGDGQRSLVTMAMQQPGGNWLVAAAGLGVLGYALHQLVKAGRGDIGKRLGIRDVDTHRAVIALGRVGTAARGVVLGITGAFLVDAARRQDPAAAGGTEDALRWLGQGWLLGLVAAGLAAYGLLQFANARYRHVPRG
jgi:hypothetical protein